ncbi:putative formamidopyrimidine-DNA glycosylase [Pyronema omphalodes]|nr:putative formamidopyrimidine-DNA glycosylase [Pyronema omphalodes]
MPEIGEVARIVNRLRQYLVGRTISSITAPEDTILYKDTTASEFQSALTGRKVEAALQHGKYFWLVMDKMPHPLMHLGMTGWIHFKNDPSYGYRGEDKPLETSWPPRFHKFIFRLQDSDDELAFVDSRRLGRVRLIHHDGYDLRNVPPLSLNGPDPVQTPISLEWLQEQLKKRKVPIKAWLLDQGAIAGIGNWVADECLYQSYIHPESYTNNLQPQHVKALHEAICSICKLAVETNADSSKFPDNWLMLHRWGKGKKGGDVMPNGDKISFLTVGGRTSAFIEKRQKQIGPNVAQLKAEKAEKARKTTGKRKVKEEEEEEEDESDITAKEEGEKKIPHKKAEKVGSHGRRKMKEEDELELVMNQESILDQIKEDPDQPVAEIRDKKTNKKSDVKKIEIEGLRRSSRLKPRGVNVLQS